MDDNYKKLIGRGKTWLNTHTRQENNEARNIISAMSYAIETLSSTHPDFQTNDPLSLDELLKMDGQPVYIVHKNSKYTRWYIWNNEPVNDIHDGLDGYGLFWFAYRWPPKEE